MITKSILDRMLHYSYLFNITGPSYRIKDKLKMNKSEECKCQYKNDQKVENNYVQKVA